MSDTHAAAMKLFRDKDVIISKQGDTVSIGCANSHQASILFNWLSSITGQYQEFDDWYCEVENFAYRCERIDFKNDDMTEWLEAAFNAGTGI